MVARNDITGDMLTSGGSNNAYRDNYDAIFGKKAAQPKVLDEPKAVEPKPNLVQVFFLAVDGGDGSTSVVFFRNEASAEAMLEYDEYYGNDGSVSSFWIPEGPNTISFRD